MTEHHYCDRDGYTGSQPPPPQPVLSWVPWVYLAGYIGPVSRTGRQQCQPPRGAKDAVKSIRLDLDLPVSPALPRRKPTLGLATPLQPASAEFRHHHRGHQETA